jgi:predicted Zn-ribbon and HTH transcriptional regulator
VLRFPLPHFRRVSPGETVQMINAEVEPLGGFIAEAFALPAFQGGTLVTILIFMFMQGGPSHVDTFDYKPALERDDGKPLPFEKPRLERTRTGMVSATRSRTCKVSGKCRPVSRKTTSVPGATRETRWANPSFAKQLFLGDFRLDLVHPHPGGPTEETPAEDVIEILRSRRVRRVPVLRNGKLVGVISRSDLVRLFSVTRWTCNDCGYFERGFQRPEKCSECGSRHISLDRDPPGM